MALVEEEKRGIAGTDLYDKSKGKRLAATEVGEFHCHAGNLLAPHEEARCERHAPPLVKTFDERSTIEEGGRLEIL